MWPAYERRFVRDAFHHVAIAGDEVRVMVDDVMARAIEDRGELCFGDRHSDRVPDALTERAGGRLDSRRVAVLRMSRRSALPLAEMLEVVERRARIR